MHFYPLQKRGSCGSSSSLSSVLPPYTRESSPFWAGRHTGTTPRPKGANERRLKRRRQRDHRRNGRKRAPRKSPNRRRRRRRSPSITSSKRSASNRNQNTPSPNASTSRHRDGPRDEIHAKFLGERRLFSPHRSPLFRKGTARGARGTQQNGPRRRKYAPPRPSFRSNVKCRLLLPELDPAMRRAVKTGAPRSPPIYQLRRRHRRTKAAFPAALEKAPPPHCSSASGRQILTADGS